MSRRSKQTIFEDRVERLLKRHQRELNALAKQAEKAGLQVDRPIVSMERESKKVNQVRAKYWAERETLRHELATCRKELKDCKEDYADLLAAAEQGDKAAEDYGKYCEERVDYFMKRNEQHVRAWAVNAEKLAYAAAFSSLVLSPEPVGKIPTPAYPGKPMSFKEFEEDYDALPPMEGAEVVNVQGNIGDKKL